MAIMEIALLVIGVIIFVISFLLPDKSSGEKSEKELTAEREAVHKIVEQEIDGMKLRVNEATNDTVEYAVDKAERSLEKVSNEKIMAVNEYAGTILEEINKNHNEVMFLYDMIRDKQNDLTNIVREADAKVKEIENVSHSAQNASETLLRGMSVATVSQKGLTQAQKAVFDDIVIPDAKPVVFEQHDKNNMTAEQKPKGIALAQSKIFAGLMGETKHEANNETSVTSVAPAASVKKEKVVMDILSGSVFSDGNIVNVEAPAGKSITAADIAAMSGRINNTPPVAEASDYSANNNDRILELSKSGMSIIDIARTLNLGVGEVKLVLELYK